MQRTTRGQLTEFETIKERLVMTFIGLSSYEWWLPWLYLVCIVIAELVTSLVQPRLGMLMYLLILLGLTMREADMPSRAMRRFMLGLTLAPPLRVLLMLLPRPELLHIAWYPVVALLFIIATTIALRQAGLSAHTLGLWVGQFRLQLWLSGIGLGLGAVEYMILQPHLLLPVLITPLGLAPALTVMLFTGFIEEIIFRGLLQSLARPVLGRCTLLYIALLSSTLHIGYLSIADTIFAFETALLFGFIVNRTGSVLGVALAHGFANLLLFWGMPYLGQHSSPSTPTLLTVTIIAMSTVVAGGFLAHQMRDKTGPAGSVGSIVTRLRILRHLYGMTYAELAACTGISVRELAAIEHGLQPVAPEHLSLLRQLLGERATITAAPTRSQLPRRSFRYTFSTLMVRSGRSRWREWLPSMLRHSSGHDDVT